MSEEIMTAGELMDQQFLPKVTLVDGLLTAGTYILAGTPKIGKSFFVTQLCWCVSEGVPFSDCKRTNPPCCIWLWRIPRNGYRGDWQICSEQTGPERISI